jgi:hypothetical protein
MIDDRVEGPACCRSVVEILFGVIGAVPTARNPSIGMDGPTWNYTTRLNIAFLVLAARSFGASSPPADARGSPRWAADPTT